MEKQTVLNILNEIKNDAQNGLIKIQEAANIPKKQEKERCEYPDAPIGEEDIQEDIDVTQGFIKNQKVMVASKDFKWEGMIPGKIKIVKKTDPPTYDIMLESNIMIKNVENNYIRPIEDDMMGGKKKKRKTKRRKRYKRRKTKRRRRRR